MEFPDGHSLAEPIYEIAMNIKMVKGGSWPCFNMQHYSGDWARISAGRRWNAHLLTISLWKQYSNWSIQLHLQLEVDQG